MQTLDKAEFKQLANQLMFDLNEQEIEEVQEDFKVLLEQIQLLDRIDTQDVEEMAYPFEAPQTFLRQDEIRNVKTQKEALSNASSVMAGHVHVPKVVK